MCPSIAVLGGGGDGGGGSGRGPGGGGGDGGAGAGSGGEDAQGDQRGAPDYEKHPECGYASHPVDVVTGRAFTHPIVDVHLPGPLPLQFRRMYSSKMADRDSGLGFGWGHTFGWEIEVRRDRVIVWNEQGIAVDFPLIRPGEETLGPWGWLLRRDAWGFAVDADDGLWRIFSERDESGKRYRLTAIEDRNRNRISLTYDDGKLVEVVDSAGRKLRVSTTKEGRIAGIDVYNAISRGQWISFATYRYDAAGDLVSVTDADGFSSAYAYGEDHLLESDTDRTGLTFHFVYDSKKRCIEAWGDYPGRQDTATAADVPQVLADGVTRVKGFSHCKLDYYDDGYSEVADSMRVRRFFGNRHGTLDKRVEGAGVVTARYDKSGHLLSRTDEMGATAHFERDVRGRLTRITDPMGRVTQIDLSPHGLPARITDPRGGVTEIARDRFGNIEQILDPTGACTSYRYDTRGLITEIVNSHGQKTRFEHDAQGNMTSMIEPNGGVTRLAYNALGYTMSVTDPLGATVRFSYSDRGDLTAVSDALGGVTRYKYDGEGKLVEHVSPGGGTRKLRWGGYNKLCEIVDEAGNVTTVTYDLDGFPVELKNPKGEVHRYEHGPRGELLSEIAFDGTRSEYRVDLAGRVVGVVDGLGRKQEIVRDACGTVVERRFEDGLIEALEYDAAGDLIAAKTGSVEVRFERDAAGRIVRQAQAVGGEEHSVERTYHGNHHLMVTSSGHSVAMEQGQDLAWRRYTLGGTHEVMSRADVVGREVERRLPGGGTIQSTFDALGRLAERTVASVAAQRLVAAGEPEWFGEQRSATTARRAHRYDWNSRLVETWDARRGATHYQLDPIGQLLAVLREGVASEVYQYDATGNIVRASDEALDYAPGNRLVTRGQTSYLYNAVGQLVEKRVPRASGGESVSVYTWDCADRLRSIADSDGTQVDFLYDALGRRVQKRVSRAPAPGARLTPVSVTTFVWDGSVLVQELKRSAAPSGDPIVEERSYWIAGDSSVAMAHRDVRRDSTGTTEGEWLHYVNDPSGFPAALVDARGEVVGELERTALGKARATNASRATTQLRFAGQYEDAEVGLHYNHFRYYDPETGRYLSRDPIGLRGGHNVFRYVADPNTMVDRFGLGPCHCVLITNNGPPERRVGTDANGNDLFAWRRNSGGSPANVHPDIEGHIPPASQLPQGSTANPDQRAKCAEPAALTDYRNWLASQPNPGNQPMLSRIQQGVVAVVPMEQRGPNRGAHKPPCDFCGPTLNSMGLSNQVMSPGAAAAAMPNVPASTFSVQPVPVFR